MPIYEYQCETCGQTIEYYAKRLLDKPETCPACGGVALKKRLSSFQACSQHTSACAHEGSCPHAHGPGCGCGCH